VTFTAPLAGATAQLAASTVATDASGHATLAVHAGTIAGSYAITARVAHAAAPATFALTNAPGAAVALVTSPATDSQTATISVSAHGSVATGISASAGLVVDAIPTTTAIDVLSTVPVNHEVTVQITVTAVLATPVGTVELLDDTGAVLGTVTLDASGCAQATATLHGPWSAHGVGAVRRPRSVRGEQLDRRDADAHRRRWRAHRCRLRLQRRRPRGLRDADPRRRGGHPAAWGRRRTMHAHVIVAGLAVLTASRLAAAQSAGGDGHVLLAGTVGVFEYSAECHALLRERTERAGKAFGSEARYAVDAGGRLAGDRLVIGPELFGAFALGSDLDTGHPIELGGSVHYRVSDSFRVGAGATAGLVHAVGTPEQRHAVADLAAVATRQRYGVWLP
jgi:hypothetical protein